MKKLLALLFVFVAVFALSACNGEEEVETGNYEPGMYFVILKDTETRSQLSLLMKMDSSLISLLIQHTL